MIKNLLQPRSEVLSGRLHGVIDLERISDAKKKALESRAKDFFDSTFVSGELRRLILGLQERLQSDEAVAGLFLAEGPKGVGKSHALLVPLHLIRSGADLKSWLDSNSLKFSAPEHARVIWKKFTDFPLESLWGVIGGEIGAKFRVDQPPSIDEFRKAVGKDKLILILDELESGIRSISDAALRQRNLNFLQMISEEANRAESNVALIASVYDGSQEPGQTLKRVSRVELRFQDSSDRRKILFHRLFAKSPLDASPEIESVIQSYLNTWKRFGIELPEGYAEQMRESYPFSPELLDVALVRIRQSKGGFQGTRGVLGFLAALIRARSSATHLITMADASLLDPEMRSWLADLDPAQNLVNSAESNLKELQHLPFADRITAAVLLASLAPSPKEPGILESELARQVIAPDGDYNQFTLALNTFRSLGSYFHERHGSLFFDTKENAHSKVRYRAISVSDDEAWEQVTDWWRTEILRDREAVFFGSVENCQAQVKSRPKKDTYLVIAPSRLAISDVHGLFWGLEVPRNTVVLVEPRDEKVNLRLNANLLKYAKDARAAELLVRSADSAEKRDEFQRIATENRRFALDNLKKTNFAFVQIIQYGSTPADCDVQREPLPSAASAEQILEHLRRTLFPSTLLAEHITGRIQELLGKKTSAVENEYRQTLGFPMILSSTGFREAVLSVVEQGSVAGLSHPAWPNPGRYCGVRPPSDDRLGEATLIAPFDQPSAERPRPHSTPSPGGGSQSGPPLPPAWPNPDSPSPEGGATLQTTFLTSRLAVRQEVARLLEDSGAAKALRVRFAITFDARDTEISTLPSFFRGSLSGPGHFSGEASLEFDGSFSKPQVEDMVERLPDFSPGSCRVTVTLDSATT